MLFLSPCRRLSSFSHRFLDFRLGEWRSLVFGRILYVLPIPDDHFHDLVIPE